MRPATMMEKINSDKPYFAEITISVYMNKTQHIVTCRAISFGVTESDIGYIVEIYGIEFPNIKELDYKQIPIESQHIIINKLKQKILAKLES